MIYYPNFDLQRRLRMFVCGTVMDGRSQAVKRK